MVGHAWGTIIAAVALVTLWPNPLTWLIAVTVVGARQLGLIKPDALLINTARGALIDGAALAAALKSGRLGGAGIDVLPHEPPLDDEPLIDSEIPNLLVTPHIAWAAREARQRCVDEMAANIRDFYGGGRRGRVV